MLVSLVSVAFPGEPNGWEKHGWGTTLKSSYKVTPAFKENGKLKEMLKALDGGDVVLETSTTFLDRRMDARWSFSKTQGLYKVKLRWEDTRVESRGKYKALLQSLKSSWGDPKEIGPDGEWIWEGRLTLAVAKRIRIATGSALEIELQGRSFGSEAAPGESKGLIGLP